MNHELFTNSRVVLLRYAGSVTSVAAALLLARLLSNFIPGLFVFPFLAAVLVSARCASKGTAVLAILLSALALAYFFLPPVNSFAVQPNALPFFASFIGCAMALTWVATDGDKADLRQKSHRTGRFALKQSSKAHGVKRAKVPRRVEFVMIGALVFGVSAIYVAPAALYYRNWWGGLVFALVMVLGIMVLVARRWR